MDGDPAVIATARDVSLQRRAERALIEAKQEAVKASETRAAFLANMSHELRTPLNSILGFGRVLEKPRTGELSPDQRKYLGYILGAGDHMLSLINDLLDLRALEQGHGDLDIRQVRIDDVLEDAVTMNRPLIETRDHKFDVDAPHGLVIDTDPRALTQILTNLLSNAAKYTEPGGSITLSVDVVDGRARFEVVDDGIGIARADQARVFDYFERAGSKHDFNMKGCGIGLALTRRLVESLGGSIGLESEREVGSTFWVTLPARRSLEETA